MDVFIIIRLYNLSVWIRFGLGMTLHLPIFCATALWAIALVPLHAQEVKSLAVFPANSEPAPSIFQAPDGFIYGLLQGTNVATSQAQVERREAGLEPYPKTCGAVYRLSPEGQISYLHSFPYHIWGPFADPTGSIPYKGPIMGSDGFLYGTTADGGVNAYGVLYRLSTDGSIYQVVAHFPYYWYIEEFFESPGGGFIARARIVDIVGDTAGRYHVQLVRIGLDGALSIVGDELPPAATLYRPSPTSTRVAAISYNWDQASPQGTLLPASSTDPTKPLNVRLRWLDLTTGETTSEFIYDFLGPHAFVQQFFPLTITLTETHLYLSVCAFDTSTSETNGGVIEVDLATGDSRTILEFPYTNMADLWDSMIYTLTPLPDGTFYYTNGAQTGFESFNTGTRLNRLNSDGSVTPLVDLNGWPMAAMGLGHDGFFYGLSLGSNVEAIGEDGLITSAARKRSAVRTPRHSAHGAFRIAPSVASPNLAPVARRDTLSLAPLKTVQALSVPVLRNDRDPEKGALTLKSVSAAVHGTAVVTTDAKGAPVVSYTPAALPARSEVLSYEIEDPAGQHSTGQLTVRGQVAGVYRGQSGSGAAQSFVARVNAAGGYSVTANVAGKTLQLSGQLDFSDGGHVQRKLSKKSSVAAHVRIETVSGANQLSYEIALGDTHVAGTAVH